MAFWGIESFLNIVFISLYQLSISFICITVYEHVYVDHFTVYLMIFRQFDFIAFQLSTGAHMKTWSFAFFLF